MKRRIPVFAAALVATALTLPANAQVRVRDHRRPRPRAVFKVSSWGPKAGPVGTVVQIDGKGFGRKTLILFGNRRLRPRRITPRRITIVVPRSYGDGTIVLRKPGFANDLVVGRYSVVSPPIVRRMSPTSGIAGTRVEIRGRSFEKNDRVLMNGRPIPVVELGSRRIVVTIPAWARTDHLVVSRDGQEARTRRKFRVLDPAPLISDISPASGPPGATVRIRGRHFTVRDKVWYGRTPVAVVKRGKRLARGCCSSNCTSEPLPARARARWGSPIATSVRSRIPPDHRSLLSDLGNGWNPR